MKKFLTQGSIFFLLLLSTFLLNAQNAADPDATFLGTAFTNSVRILKIQTDGKILVGGDFTAPTNRIIRLNANGSTDNSFNVGLGTDWNVTTFAIQSDGKILAGGGYQTYNGANINYVVRLNSDGSVDNAFGLGADNTVNTIAIQSDGKILVGGNFQSFNGVTQNRLVRLNADGTIDNVFNNGGTGPGGTSINVTAIALQSDGKILVGGYFTTFNGVTNNRLVRLNANGTIDNTFVTGGIGGSNTFASAIAIQSDGKILVGGSFTTFNGITNKNRLVRLNADGSIDATFSTNIGTAANNTVNSIALQSDGKVIVGGTFTTFNSSTKNHLVRLNADGTIDNTFNGTGTSGGTGAVNTIAIQSDGKILTGGNFTTYNGSTYNYIVRLQGSPITTGIMDNKVIKANIYPNPAENDITVEFPDQNGIYEMRIYSLQGVIKKSVQLNNLQNKVNLEGIDGGLYIYEIWQDEKRKASGTIEVK